MYSVQWYENHVDLEYIQIGLNKKRTAICFIRISKVDRLNYISMITWRKKKKVCICYMYTVRILHNTSGSRGK